MKPWWYTLLGGLIASLIWSVAYLDFSPVPYSNATLSVRGITPEGTYLDISFYKNPECTNPTLVVVGNLQGETDILDWVDVEGAKGSKRQEGWHNATLLVDTEGRSYDSLTVKTRHLCGEEKIDKTFGQVQYENIP